MNAIVRRMGSVPVAWIVLCTLLSVIPLAGFNCDGTDPCDPPCEDDNGSACLILIGDTYCHCGCGLGDVYAEFVDENGTTVKSMKLENYSPRRDVGRRWCTNADLPTCRGLKVYISFVCKDEQCVQLTYTNTTNPVGITIACNAERVLWTTFKCGYAS